jgi:hypothetical protein
VRRGAARCGSDQQATAECIAGSVLAGCECLVVDA